MHRILIVISCAIGAALCGLISLTLGIVSVGGYIWSGEVDGTTVVYGAYSLATGLISLGLIVMCWKRIRNKTSYGHER